MRGSIQGVLFMACIGELYPPFAMFLEKNVLVTSPVIEMIDLATEVEGLTLSIAIQQTTRFTSTLSNMSRWKFLLVEVTKTASMQL